MAFNMTVELICESHALAAVLRLCSQGVLVKAEVPATIRGFLCGQLRIENDYLDNRINTLFLNGKAVDDVDDAVVKNGAVLALSASMPGFVGAAFRRGGYYATMRDNVSYVADGDAGEATHGLVKLKLFNMTCPELGPLLLASGVYVRPEELEAFFADRPAAFWNGCRSARVNGQELDPRDLLHTEWSQVTGPVRLRAAVPAPEQGQSV